MNRWKVAALLFGSGMSALIYQTAWLREFRLIFGASTAASAAVLAIFMGGLGIGGLVLGRRADAVRSPLGMYANLELGVAAFSALTPFLILLARAIYVAVGGTVVLGGLMGTIVRLALAVVVLGVPTFLMGGTLPAAARSVETSTDLSRRHLALLYGLNTVGAVAGALISTFYLLELLGNRRTLWFACAVNALVAIAARTMARRLMAEEAESGESPEPATAESDTTVAVGESPRFVLAAAGIVGFAFLLMEIVWYRMLAPLLGGSTFTFGLILAVALLGIGLGGAAYSLVIANRRVSLNDFALTAAFEALCISVPYFLGDRLAILALLFRDLGAIGFRGHMIGWTIVTAIVVLPASFVAGIQFPLLIALLGQGKEKVGRHVGLAYLWNTIGAIVGSLAGGFGLLPLLTAPGCWKAVVALLALLGVVAASRHAVRTRERRAVVPVAVAVISILMLGAAGPTAAWRHSGIGAGRSAAYEPTRNGLKYWINHSRRTRRWESEGVESSVALSAWSGWSFLINGKTDGSVRGDAGTQVMAGLMGAILHPEPKSALVVGLGTGSSAGWLGAVGSIDRVDVIELEPSLVEVARACAPVNRDVLNNPKVRLWFGDAREWVLTSRDRYDIIFSEPSNPYRAGIASLFTREFYESARDRLQPGGMFLQWLQAYEVDSETVETVYATLGSVFSNVETWRTTAGDLLLVATEEPVDYGTERLRRRIAEEPIRSALAKVWRVNDLEGLLARFIAGDKLTRAIQVTGQVLNTDDRTPIEFGFARSVGNKLSRPTSELRAEAARLGAARPEVHGKIDWSLVDERTAESLAVDAVVDSVGGAFDLAQSKRVEAILAWSHVDFASAARAWSAQDQAPSDDAELLIAAESLADTGSESAMPFIEQLGRERPIEARAVLARLRWREGRYDEAADALVWALEAYRHDAWPFPELMARTMLVAQNVATESDDRRIAARLHATILEPFCVRMLEEVRFTLLIRLAERMDGAPCNDAMKASLALFESSPPWNPHVLDLRAKCYTAWDLPQKDRAQEDLWAYLDNEPPPFMAAREIKTEAGPEAPLPGAGGDRRPN